MNGLDMEGLKYSRQLVRGRQNRQVLQGDNDFVILEGQEGTKIDIVHGAHQGY